ncbi:hypothetical protein Glove_21g330 [Diversispora epigaea]|uniref:Uncharacterized protein n=1 Tax=Diversispora epigaea TaxID=1348612 RepID=A0A397JWE5_9GLOM|nr:hypothetical protein Glove_21g330 [Diversispora epigaea]
MIMHSAVAVDLGLLSKSAEETGIFKDNEQKVVGVIPYLAPEVLSGNDNYSKESDLNEYEIKESEPCKQIEECNR